MTVKAALGAEMKAHLGDVKHDPEGHHTGNSCNGYSGKTLKGNHGEVDIDVPRDRNGAFEPQIVRKGQCRLCQKISAPYLQAMFWR